MSSSSSRSFFSMARAFFRLSWGSWLEDPTDLPQTRFDANPYPIYNRNVRRMPPRWQRPHPRCCPVSYARGRATDITYACIQSSAVADRPYVSSSTGALVNAGHQTCASFGTSPAIEVCIIGPKETLTVVVFLCFLDCSATSFPS